MYPTTIKEDEELLLGNIDDQIERNCILFRLEQKKVLKDVVDIGKMISQAVKVQAEVPKYQTCIDYVKSMLEPWCKKNNIQE